MEEAEEGMFFCWRRDTNSICVFRLLHYQQVDVNKEFVSNLYEKRDPGGKTRLGVFLKIGPSSI